MSKYTKTLVQEAIKEKCWLNGNCEKLVIKDMSTLHINNCVQFLIAGKYLKDSTHNIPVPREIKKAKSKFMSLFEDEMNARSTRSSNAS